MDPAAEAVTSAIWYAPHEMPGIMPLKQAIIFATIVALIVLLAAATFGHMGAGPAGAHDGFRPIPISVCGSANEDPYVVSVGFDRCPDAILPWDSTYSQSRVQPCQAADPCSGSACPEYGPPSPRGRSPPAPCSDTMPVLQEQFCGGCQKKEHCSGREGFAGAPLFQCDGSATPATSLSGAALTAGAAMRPAWLRQAGGCGGGTCGRGGTCAGACACGGSTCGGLPSGSAAAILARQECDPYDTPEDKYNPVTGVGAHTDVRRTAERYARGAPLQRFSWYELQAGEPGSMAVAPCGSTARVHKSPCCDARIADPNTDYLTDGLYGAALLNGRMLPLGGVTYGRIRERPSDACFGILGRPPCCEPLESDRSPREHFVRGAQSAPLRPPEHFGEAPYLPLGTPPIYEPFGEAPYREGQVARNEPFGEAPYREGKVARNEPYCGREHLTSRPPPAPSALTGAGVGLGATRRDPRFEPGPAGMLPSGSSCAGGPDAQCNAAGHCSGASFCGACNGPCAAGDTNYSPGSHAGGPSYGAYTPALFQPAAASWDSAYVFGFGDPPSLCTA